jgi:hypothetical protein
MHQHALTVIWITSLALPYLAFVAHNPFRSHWLTLLRAIVAIAIGWAFMLTYVVVADAVHRSLASTPEQIDALDRGDGAKFAFAWLFGWIIPAFIVGTSWILHGVIFPRRRARSADQAPPLR